MRFDLNLFRVFDAIYASGSLTRAAEMLHLSQPAVSHALGRLRERLHDPLFRREGHRMVATPRAHALAPDVQRALGMLDAGIRGASVFDPASSTRVFRLGLREALEFPVLPALVTRLRADAPGVALESVPFSRGAVERDLARGLLDLVLDVPMPMSRDIRRSALHDDALCVVMRTGHPLSAANPTREQWLAAAHVVVSGRPAGLSLEDDALLRMGLHRHIGLRCQNYQSACAAVAGSDLLLTAPRRVAVAQLAAHGLHLAPLPLRLPALRIQIYWHHAVDDDAGCRWLRHCVQEAATVMRGTMRTGDPT